MAVTYSKSQAANLKRIYDVQITEFTALNNARIDFHKGDYIKQLIKLMSRGTVEVKSLTAGLQFFYIKGGAEGFLDAATFADIDASRVVEGGSTTSGGTGITMVFDMTNLLAVFDQRGNFVNSALLSRPLSITVPPPRPRGFNGWSEEAANKPVAAWDNCNVNLYHNTNPHFAVHYFGLQVDDTEGYYKGQSIMIDFHKEEATNGCIFIIDENTPPMPDDSMTPAQQTAALRRVTDFEPKLITDVQAKLGAQTASPAGTMRVVNMF